MQADLFTETNIIDQNDRRTVYATRFDGITVEVDEAWLMPGAGAHFAGIKEFLGGPDHIPGKVRRVLVMSWHAAGEIRRYVLDEHAMLRLAGPCYGGEWVDMDLEVVRVLGASVHPYTITAGGSVE